MKTDEALRAGVDSLPPPLVPVIIVSLGDENDDGACIMNEGKGNFDKLSSAFTAL